MEDDIGGCLLFGHGGALFGESWHEYIGGFTG